MSIGRNSLGAKLAKAPLLRFPALTCLLVILWMGCTAESREQARSPHPEEVRNSSANSGEATHDLSADESLGGHTLTRHVGRTDAQLRERLERERHISAASTYTDRRTAEKAVAAALDQQKSRINSWLRGSRSGDRRNLVLDYDSPQPLGRTLNRDHSAASPCAHAIIVLRQISSDASGPGTQNGDKFYVLTTYPECRP